jgi:hypothetical protein
VLLKNYCTHERKGLDFIVPWKDFTSDDSVDGGILILFQGFVGIYPKYPTMNAWASIWYVVDTSRSQDCIDEWDEYYVPVHVACSSCCFGPECAEDGVRCRNTVKQGADCLLAAIHILIDRAVTRDGVRRSLVPGLCRPVRSFGTSRRVAVDRRLFHCLPVGP